jgi:hypothetical protein
MAVGFRSSGKLGELLQVFKSQYLSKLSKEDLEQEVTISVSLQAYTEDAEDEAYWLKKKLVEVIEDE